MSDDDRGKWLLRAEQVVVDWERANDLPLLHTRAAADLTSRIAGALADAQRMGRVPRQDESPPTPHPAVLGALGDAEALRAVWDAAPDALALSDAAGRVLAVNPAYCTLYGFRPEQVVGQSFALIFPEDARAGAELAYREVFTRGQPSLHEAQVRRADGVDLLVEARATFVERDGELVAMLSRIRDLPASRATERHAAAGRLSGPSDQATLVVTDTHNGQPYRWEFQRVQYPAARLVVTDERVLDPGGAARLPLDALWLDLTATDWPSDAHLPPVVGSASVHARGDQVVACSCGGPPCPHVALYAWVRAHGWRPPEPSPGEHLARLRDRALYRLNRLLGLTACVPA